TYDVKAFWVNTLFSGSSTLELSGYQAHWNAGMKTLLKGRQELWQGSDFAFDEDRFNVGSQQEASYELKEPITIEIDLAKLDVGDKFTLLIEVVVETNNRRQRESYVSAFFRDPVSIEGATIETFGLDPVAVPYRDPPPDEPQAPECSSGDEAAAGTLQFAASTFFAPEMPTGTTQVLITRTGGTQGEVSATVRTHDGTALAGTDYEAVDSTVYFGPGEDEPRVLEVPLALDAIAEPDKSLTVTLSDPRGCAALGSPATATLTILDDDRPEPEPPPSGIDETFGTNGKATLTSFGGGDSDMALQADGKIVMVGGRFIDFVLARFNADGSLDTSFGTGGKVTTDIAGGFAQERARAVAIQPDGKIVVAGESSLPSGDLAVALVRYHADGTLDTTFGSGGKAFDTPVVGRAWDVAILPDGRIVVAGAAPVANNPQDFGDFLVARYTAKGTIDASFSSGGTVVTDMTSRTDLARNIVVQPDGALVVSGDPIGSDPSPRTAVARYSANGVLDPSFGPGGKVVIAGALVGRGLALQSDGRLVLVGSMAVQNVQNDFTHFAVLRLNADGTFDDSFGTEGATTTSMTGLTDVAHAVALQADGRIVVAGEGNLVNPNFALARYNTDGTLDTSFAIDGKLVVDFFGLQDRAEGVVLQADGKIVAGGLVVNSTNGYGLVRVNP
ncbi:MAG: Calx-beta domain-containing protein, partial [Steroidobacteraceae bacterium]